MTHDGQVLWNKKQSFWGFHWNSYLFISRIVNQIKKHTHTHNSQWNSCCCITFAKPTL